MDRQLVYPGQIPLETDILDSNKYPYIGLAKLAAAVLGTSTLINAFTCSPTAPASLQVVVGPGEIYSLQNIDNTAYSSLAADTTHSIAKQGVILDSTTLSCPAPVVVGDSINYLIQIGFSETDGGSVVLPYYNSSNPAVPYSGPNNSGQPNNTIRQDGVNIQVKAGVAATTGTQTTPSPDTGFVGAFVVIVANGQTTITSGNISTYSGAPFITETLTQKISQPTADARYAQFAQIQNGSLIYGVDTSGAANTITATLSPAITSYVAGMSVCIKVANTITGTATVNLNSLGAKTIKSTSGSNLNSGDIVSGEIAHLTYDGTNFQLVSSGLTLTQIQAGAYNYAVDSGIANAYVASLTPTLTTYAAGNNFYIKIANTNTSASTININSLGAKSIKLTSGSDPNAGDLAANMVAELIYDGTNFQLLNPRNGYPPFSDSVPLVKNSTTPTKLLQMLLSGLSAATTRVWSVPDCNLPSFYVQRVTSFFGSVATGTTITPYDDTIPQNTEGDQYLSVTITPKSVTNRLMIWLVLNATTSSSGGPQGTIALFQDSNVNAIAANAILFQTTGTPQPFSLLYEMAAGTTSATTFNIRLGGSIASTITVNGAVGSRKLGGVLYSGIIITEVTG